MSARVSTFTILAISVGTFLAWGFHGAGFDLWWDELDSLTEYALVDFSTTVTKYPYPNNHIFFNLLNNALTRAWGVRDIYQIMDQASILRWVQWLISAGTVAFVYFVGRRNLGSIGGALGAVLLVTSLPFLNFAMQLRGYALSMFFVAGLLFCCALPCGSKHSVRDALLTAALSFALLYTVPSNVYFLLALALIVLLRLLVDVRGQASAAPNASRSKPDSRETETRTIRFYLLRVLLRHHDAWSLAAISLGAAAALIAYLPVLDQVLHNRFVTDTPADRWFVLSSRLPEVLHGFLSERYLLLVAVIPGLVLAIRDLLRRRSLPQSSSVAPERAVPGQEHSAIGSEELATRSVSIIPALLALLLLPFLISFLRNDAPFQRTFIHLAPVFALLIAATVEAARALLMGTGMEGARQRETAVSAEATRAHSRLRSLQTGATTEAASIGGGWKRLGRRSRVGAWMPVTIAAYSTATLSFVHMRVQHRLDDALTHEVREQNIIANFYQAEGFRPLELCRHLAAELSEKPGLVLLANEIDRVAWTFYLQKFDIPSYALAQFREDPTETTTHGGVYQLSQGRRGERSFFQWPMRIEKPFERGDRLTPLMLYISAYDPADRIYVITGYSNLIARVLRARYPEFLVERIEVPGSYGLFRLTRHGAPR